MNAQFPSAPGSKFDLHFAIQSCDKNNNHEDFIPITKFKIEHLPKKFQKDKDFSHLINHLSKLTVKLTVTTLSPQSTKAPNSNTGNGLIFYQDLKGSGSIKNCKDTRLESGSEQQLGEIIVLTAHHLVSDQDAAEKTECAMFFDGVEVQPKILRSSNLLDSCDKRDISILAFKIYEGDTVREIENSLREYEYLSRKLHLKYLHIKESDRLCITVSHPHGCYKYLTLGHWRKHEEGYYTYTAKTCPSSSGGSIFLLGVRSHNMVHRGVSPSGENCSSKETVFVNPELSLREV
uniref:Uncharacterized protein n=1 Tax=Biomphalaria glabrata TaxID=6526 RepID=A0A2C9LIQ3_BIOGL